MARGIDIREELLKFYNTYYSAGVMCLAVYGKGIAPLDSLKELSSGCCSHFKRKLHWGNLPYAYSSTCRYSQRVSKPQIFWERVALLSHLCTP